MDINRTLCWPFLLHQTTLKPELVAHIIFIKFHKEQ
jgi:hypothetical protein